MEMFTEQRTELKRGWLSACLQNRSMFRKHWKRSYYLFCEIKTVKERLLHLFYFKDKSRYKAKQLPRGYIDITQAKSIGIGRQNINGRRHIIQIEVPGGTYYLSSSNCEDMFTWNLVLRSHAFNDNSTIPLLGLRPYKTHSQPELGRFLTYQDRRSISSISTDYSNNSISEDGIHSEMEDLMVEERENIIRRNHMLKKKYIYCNECNYQLDSDPRLEEDVYDFILWTNECEPRLYEEIPTVDQRNLPNLPATVHSSFASLPLPTINKPNRGQLDSLSYESITSCEGSDEEIADGHENSITSLRVKRRNIGTEHECNSASLDELLAQKTSKALSNEIDTRITSLALHRGRNDGCIYERGYCINADRRQKGTDIMHTVSEPVLHKMDNPYLSLISPCLHDGSTPLRVNSEKCADYRLRSGRNDTLNIEPTGIQESESEETFKKANNILQYESFKTQSEAYIIDVNDSARSDNCKPHLVETSPKKPKQLPGPCYQSYKCYSLPNLKQIKARTDKELGHNVDNLTGEDPLDTVPETASLFSDSTTLPTHAKYSITSNSNNDRNSTDFNSESSFESDCNSCQTKMQNPPTKVTGNGMMCNKRLHDGTEHDISTVKTVSPEQLSAYGESKKEEKRDKINGGVLLSVPSNVDPDLIDRVMSNHVDGADGVHALIPYQLFQELIKTKQDAVSNNKLSSYITFVIKM